VICLFTGKMRKVLEPSAWIQDRSTQIWDCWDIPFPDEVPSTRSRSQVRPTYISPTPPVSSFGAKIYQGYRAAASSTPRFSIVNDSFDFDSGLGLTRQIRAAECWTKGHVVRNGANC
jgi:hypothetical protein